MRWYILQCVGYVAGNLAHVTRNGSHLQWYDANISLPGCDKNTPGVLIAMARLNRPALMVYGGTIKPGHSSVGNKPIDVVSAFQSYGVACSCIPCPVMTPARRGASSSMPQQKHTST